MQWVRQRDQLGQGDTTGYFQQLFDANGEKIGSEIRVNGPSTDGAVSEDFVRQPSLASGGGPPGSQSRTILLSAATPISAPLT